MSGALPFLRGDADSVARRGGAIVSRAAFLAETEELAAQLPDRPFVVNFCADRYRFAVGWAAAMRRGQVTLLPSGRDGAAVAGLREDYAALYVLTDDDTDDLPGPRFDYPPLAGTGGVHEVPAFAPEQVAAVLFTSGSTGRPQPSPRRWGRLVAGSLAAGAALGVDRYPGAALVATVPHPHSYGLESAVVLPLQHGLLLTAERPFFPADVAGALAGDRPGILVTTPVHLRALVGDAAEADPGPGFGVPVRAGFVLSATAPLSADLAALAEAAFGAPVLEIYGCSEAGQLATRRTVEGPVWRCLQGYRLRQDAAGTRVSGPAEDDVLLADEIELVDEVRFILQGRTADMVNVAGKRGSLAYLTRELTAIEGVEDGVFLTREDDATGTPARLAALVVAPGLDAAAVVAALRPRIDPAFLPRPLHVVDRLPRDALGKLPRAELLRMLAPAEAAATAPILLLFPADHPAGPGHFPGNPIIPGALLLDAVVAALAPGGWSGAVESAKFHHPVRPGDSVGVTHTTVTDATGAAVTRFACRLAGSGPLVLSGVLRSPSPSR
jgi:acyl-CoA synthetase (AMP-forming)/AMP-acid ligase II